MQGLFTFYWICTLTLLLTVFQDLRNFRRKKVVFFTRGAPRGIWKMLANYTLFFVVNHQIPGTTPKSNHMYLLLFFGKKVNHFEKFFRGNIMHISQKCTTIRTLTFYTIFTFGKRIIFFRKTHNLKHQCYRIKKGF